MSRLVRPGQLSRVAAGSMAMAAARRSAFTAASVRRGVPIITSSLLLRTTTTASQRRLPDTWQLSTRRLFSSRGQPPDGKGSGQDRAAAPKPRKVGAKKGTGAGEARKPSPPPPPQQQQQQQPGPEVEENSEELQGVNVLPVLLEAWLEKDANRALLQDFRPLSPEESELLVSIWGNRKEPIDKESLYTLTQTIGVHKNITFEVEFLYKGFFYVPTTMRVYLEALKYITEQMERASPEDLVAMPKKAATSSRDQQKQETSPQKKQEERGKEEEEPSKASESKSESAGDETSEGSRSTAGGGSDGGDGGPKWRSITWTDVLVGTVTWFILWPALEAMLFGNSKEITWQEVRRMFLDKGLVERFIVQEGRVVVQLNREATVAMYGDNNNSNGQAGTVHPNTEYYFTIGSVEGFENRLDEAQNDLGVPPSQRIPVKYGSKSPWLTLLLGFGPTLLLVGLLVYSTRQMSGRGGNQMFGFGKSTAKKFNHESAVKVKFTDVAGMDEAKLEIMEFVSFLKTPEKFRKLGAKIPRGAILAGPPGTGKTLLAKATAGECQVPFFSVSGSEFVEMFVGVGPSRVRDLFATARKNAPCIVFIDEIDAIGRSRNSNRMGGGNDEREATLNQILTEMDGFNTNEQIVVLAGTNRADVLDKALMRPGRFDRHIFVDRPTQKGREEIFRVHLQKIVTSDDKEMLNGRLATLTPGFSGADIAHVVNEAALIAARYNADAVTVAHFEQAIERTIAGLEKKSLVLRPEEKRTVAYHEAGHAICGWFLKDADPLLKVSIIPRGQGALGYAQYLPQDAYLMSTSQLMDRMAMTLGGRVSEELHFDVVTTGASDDFKKVTSLATNMVTQWGMSEKVGPIHFDDGDGQRLQKPFAENTGQIIDAEVRRIVDEAYQLAKTLLTRRKREVGLIAEELLRKEMLTRDDLVRILGPRPFADNHQAFEKYFGGGQTSSGSPAEKDTKDGKEVNTPPPPPPAGIPEETDTPPQDAPMDRPT